MKLIIAILLIALIANFALRIMRSNANGVDVLKTFLLRLAIFWGIAIPRGLFVLLMLIGLVAGAASIGTSNWGVIAGAYVVLFAAPAWGVAWAVPGNKSKS